MTQNHNIGYQSYNRIYRRMPTYITNPPFRALIDNEIFNHYAAVSLNLTRTQDYYILLILKKYSKGRFNINPRRTSMTIAEQYGLDWASFDVKPTKRFNKYVQI